MAPAKVPPPTPADVLRSRIAELTGDLAVISAQLADPIKQEQTDPEGYRKWARSARYAHALKVREVRNLEVELKRIEAIERERARAAKQVREAQQRELERQKQEALERTGDVSKLVLGLYTIAARACKRTGQQPALDEREVLDAAHAYLVQQGIFVR